MKKLVITDAAREDLRNIARYTEQQWGATQKRRYMNTIRGHLARLRRSPSLGAARDDIRPGLRGVASGRHVVFYREVEDSIAIVRVLHERMDPHRHLLEALVPK